MKTIASVGAMLMFVLAACGGGINTQDPSSTDAPRPGDAVAGAAVYTRGCSACHGTDLEGVTGLGKPLSPSLFVIEHGEDDVAALILVGVPADDPGNMTGIEMAPKGGNASLTAQDIANVAAFLKSQQ